jgi:hypothetical protein
MVLFTLFSGNPNTCRQILQPSQLKDVQWATDTCRISFNSVGIWPEGADGTDINNCARSHDGSLLVTGDDFGTVRLYQYPASNIKVYIQFHFSALYLQFWCIYIDSMNCPKQSYWLCLSSPLIFKCFINY